MAIYKIETKSDSQSSTFQMDTLKKTFRRQRYQKQGAIAKPKTRFEILDVTITEESSGANMQEVWVALCGKPKAIGKGVVDTYHLARVEASMIFDELDKHGDDEEVCITYIAIGNDNPILRNGNLAKWLHGSQRAIVGSLFGLEEDEVIRLSSAWDSEVEI